MTMSGVFLEALIGRIDTSLKCLFSKVSRQRVLVLLHGMKKEKLTRGFFFLKIDFLQERKQDSHGLPSFIKEKPTGRPTTILTTISLPTRTNRLPPMND